MNIVPLIAIASSLVAENAVAYLCGLNLRMTNGFFAAGAMFFLLSLSPRSMVGFAVTAREWGDKWRDWLDLQEKTVTPHFEKRWAAHRSIAVLSVVVLLGFASVLARSHGGGSETRTDVSCLLGMCFGFWGGYLAVMGRRRPVSTQE
ncbi:hypothetical protein [Dyella sp. 20L07]|uniref:hypothetical protein n=1 Tax=Dyella sp. 20L07 TaxID=3384240 RepID=UPI003D2E4D06